MMITRTDITATLVQPMFPHTPLKNIQKNLPYVLDGLLHFSLLTKEMVLVALGTIRAETEAFVPISEYQSKYNTTPNGHPFNLYDNRADLGNEGPPDGERYKGRGFIQLTGKANYRKYGPIVGVDILTNPDLANEPDVAGKVLAAFLDDKRTRIYEALKADDLRRVRRLVNGGSHGLDRFIDAYKTGLTLI